MSSPSLSLLRSLPLALALCPLARSQDLPWIYVSDTGNDQIQRLIDANGDGDYDDSGETVVFYDDTLGAFSLSNNLGVAVDPFGLVYVSDTSFDRIIVLEDIDGDGSCHDAGEARLFFDDTNQSGIDLSAANDMSFDGTRLWIASAGADVVDDAILWLEDSNSDGDALDVGESMVFYEPAPGAANATDSVPQDVRVGLDGRVYYVDNPSTGSLERGIYVLEDADGSGDIDASEVDLFYEATDQFLTAQHWGMFQDFEGAWYLMDSTNAFIWRVRDVNGNGRIDNATEETLFYESVAPSLIWEVQVAASGELYVAESQAPDRILRMFDANGDGQIDPGTEVEAVYDETTSSVNISNPRSLALDRNRGALFTNYCVAGVNSTGSAALISALGSRSVAWNDLELTAQPVPAGQPGVFFYGPDAVLVPFGNGFRCIAPGALGVARLPVTNATTDQRLRWSLDVTTSPTMATRILGGSTWLFQAWYRDPAAGGANFNLSNGMEVTFLF